MRIKNPPWPTHGMKVSLGTALLLASQAGFAGTITVNSDSGMGIVDDELCNLREAVDAANNNEDRNGCVIDGTGPDDTIVFSGVTAITLPGGEVTPELEIDDELDGETQIDGGAGVIIDGNGDFIFRVLSETTMSSLTLQNADLGDNGAAIFATAPLTVQNSNINDSSANGMLDDGMTSASGGGIFTTANLTLMNTSMARNFAPRAGGAIEVDGRGGPITVSITGGTFDGNGAGVDAMGSGMNAAPGNGGVLHITDPDGNVTTTITGATFTDNFAALEGGALWNGAGLMTVDGVTITGNTASGDASDDGGGGIFNNGGTLNVNSVSAATLIDGNLATGTSGSGGGIFNNGGELNVDAFESDDAPTFGVTISNNLAPRAGGGIESLNGDVLLVGVTLSGNTAGDVPVAGGDPITAAPGNGGGVHMSGAGELDLFATITENRRNTVSNNVAANEGGGLWFNIDGGTVNDSDVTGNEAAGDGAANGGGGIFHNAGNTPNDGDTTGGLLRLANTTVIGNTATGESGSGGGIFVNAGGSLNATASVIAGNTANRAGGGIETRSSTEGAASADLTGVSLTGNTAGPAGSANPGNGGGLHVSGEGASTTVSLSLITDNVAASEGGGLWNFAGSNMTVRTSSVLRNVAAGADDDNGGGGIFDNGGSTEVSDSRILLNDATGASGSGGGIFVNTGATVEVFNSTIAANTAQRAGGGIENNAGTVVLDRVNLGGTDTASGNIAGMNPGNGGGLHTTGAGSVDINESLVGYNTAGEGGGLWNSPAGDMIVGNTSVSNNQASGDGGGIYQEGDSGSGLTQVLFSTVTQNVAGGIGGGLGTGSQSPLLNVDASIIAENTDSSADGATNDASTAVVFTGSDEMNLSGNNLIGSNGGFDGPLRLYGPAIDGGWMGSLLPTAVHPLLADGDAVDQAASCNVDIDGPEAVDADQRQVTRPQGMACDLGSFEVADIPVLDVTTTNGDAVTVTGDSDEVVLFGVQVTNSGAADVDLGGFAGGINVNNLPAGVDLTALVGVEVELYEDTNGDGAFQADGDTFVSDVTLDVFGSLRFSAELPSAVTLTGSDSDTPDNASRSYIAVANLVEDMDLMEDMEAVEMTALNAGPKQPVSLSWQAPALAGGALLGLLGLFSVGGIRRRTRWILLITSSALILTACGGGGGGSGGGGGAGPGNPDPAPNPLTAGDLRFVVDTLLGDSQTDGQVIGEGLPANGPAITITGLPESTAPVAEG